MDDWESNRVVKCPGGVVVMQMTRISPVIATYINLYPERCLLYDRSITLLRGTS